MGQTVSDEAAGRFQKGELLLIRRHRPSDRMKSNYCSRCGARLVPPARFCVECGAAAHEPPPAPARRMPLDRFAAALIVAAVVGVTGAAVWVGSRFTPPPPVVPPRAAATNSATMPVDHPPIEIPDEVRQVIRRMADSVTGKPDDLQAWKELAHVQYRAGQIEPGYLSDAASSYGHVLERDPQDLDALRFLGNIAFDRDDPQRAIEYYQRYLTLKPDDPTVRTDLGTMYFTAHDGDAAIKSYQAALGTDSTFFQAQFNLGVAYEAAGDTPQAIAAFEQARDLAADDAARQRVDGILVQLTGNRVPPPAVRTETGIQADVERIFRSHPIVGPKLDRIDWPSRQTAQVILRDFPMDGMPPAVRQRFIERIRTGVRDQKARHGVSQTLRVELIDTRTGQVMETVTE